MLAWPAESLQQQSCHFVISPQVFLLQPRALLTSSLTYQDITDTKTKTLYPQFLIPAFPLTESELWSLMMTLHWPLGTRALCSVLCLSSLGTNPTLPGAGPNTASHWSATANTASDWRRKWRYLCVYRNTAPRPRPALCTLSAQCGHWLGCCLTPPAQVSGRRDSDLRGEMFKAVMAVSSDKNRIPMPYVWESWGIV